MNSNRTPPVEELSEGTERKSSTGSRTWFFNVCESKSSRLCWRSQSPYWNVFLHCCRNYREIEIGATYPFSTTSFRTFGRAHLEEAGCRRVGDRQICVCYSGDYCNSANSFLPFMLGILVLNFWCNFLHPPSKFSHLSQGEGIAWVLSFKRFHKVHVLSCSRISLFYLQNVSSLFIHFRQLLRLPVFDLNIYYWWALFFMCILYLSFVIIIVRILYSPVIKIKRSM